MAKNGQRSNKEKKKPKQVKPKEAPVSPFAKKTPDKPGTGGSRKS